MPDRYLRTQAVIPYDSGLPGDVTVNTFHFFYNGAGSAVDAATAIESKLQTFYGALQAYWPSMVGLTITYKTYDLAEPEPREPVKETTFAIVPGASDALPHEVAACLSFAADPVSGIEPASLRGRIFFGPIANQSDVLVPDGRMDPIFQDVLRDAGAELVNPGAGNIYLSIYSRTRDEAGQPLANSYARVTHGWVDNAFDTQRRRGLEATNRLTFTI